MSADPGGPVSLHQAGTAQQPTAPPPKWGRLSHPGRAPRDRGRSDLSRGGRGPKRSPKVPPRSTHHLTRSCRAPRPFPGRLRKCVAARAVRQASAAGPSPAQPAPRRSLAGTSAAENRRQAATHR
ncbi:hypothetical protein NDU88_001310 [Pleurodeles waltl]|uniref:Uncharacterized protein n=1 Tax=Pleurodeles waltl TaxID=8319 RepID=A0AAV7SYV4_PLEWA|nr:hypothetical protein NDU88_001310 [Pleurodeles waltl]